MIIHVKLFAIVKERLGQESIEIQLPANSNVTALRSKIAETFPAVAELMPHVLIAVNTQIASADHPLDENSEVAIIPPVSGG